MKTEIGNTVRVNNLFHHYHFQNSQCRKQQNQLANQSMNQSINYPICLSVTYGSAKTPGVSSCELAHPAEPEYMAILS
jgi:hypothetical protein